MTYEEKMASIVIFQNIESEEDCASIELNKTQIDELAEKNDNINLKIEIEEKDTTTTRNAESSTQLVNEAIKLDIGSSSQQFIISGFPYVGEFNIKNHDGTPREDDIEVCVRLYKDLDEIRNFLHRENIWSMDEDEIAEIGQIMVDIKYSSKCHQLRSEGGKIKFFVPMHNIPKDVTKLSIKATAINHPSNETTGMKQPVEKLDVSLTHTTADLTISVKEKQRSKLACDEDFTAKVHFSSKADQEFDLHYHALSKGEIFKSGSIKVNSGKSNDLDSLVGDSKELPAYEDNNEKQSHEQKVLSNKDIILPIDYKVSPSLNLVVFVNDGNQTLTDSHTYDVEACQQHKVKTDWSEEKVYPGAPVTFSVAAQPDSLCAISTTDKSVDLLGNKNKVTSETIGKLQADIGKRKTSPSDHNSEFQMKFPQSYKAIQVCFSNIQNRKKKYCC